MIGELQTDEKGKITAPVSEYQPPKEVADLTVRIKKDYATGYEIMHRPFEEFNNKNLIERMNEDQKNFNSYVLPESSDPSEAWRWHGVRPITRNKIISIAAHFVTSTIYPSVFAQNDQDEEDKEAASIMRYLMEWNIRNSDYELSFLFGIMSALVNPIAYFQTEYAEVLQTVKKINDEGKLVKEEVVDDVLSGFQVHVPPPDEIFIANPYQFYLEKQRFLIRRRFIDYDEAERIYGDHPNFKYVQPGIKALYNENEGLFYNQYDEGLETLAEEVVYYNRLEDLEVPFVNGIYMGDENVEANRMKHRDNEDRPRYPFVKFGYEPIDAKRFFFYKSAAAKLGPDQELVDRMYQMVMDGTFLAVMPPIATIGTGEVGSEIIFPGAVTNFPSEARIETIGPRGENLSAGYRALQEIEKSITESSQAEIRGGKPEGKRMTAYEISRLEANARIQLGIFGKMIASAVVGLGRLLVDDILQKQTVAEAEEILGGETRLKFRTFLLPNQIEGGKKVTRKIKFDESLIGKKMTPEEVRKRSYEVLKEEGGLDSEKRIYYVNPELFRRLKYMVYFDWQTLMPANQAFEKAIKLEAYDRMINNPFIDQEAVTRDFLVEPLAKGETDKYMRKKPAEIEKIAAMLVGGGKGKNKTSRLVEQATREPSLKEILTQP